MVFEKSLSSEDTIWVQLHSQLKNRDAMALLATLKSENKLILFSHQMLERQTLEAEKREQLQRFFELSLGNNPDSRPNNLQHLLACLDPKR